MTPANEGVVREQYLGFSSGGSEYALGILTVREILQFESLTPVPGTPRWIRGVINLRGSVVPVVDLALKLGLPETAITRLTCILVVEVTLGAERTLMGLMADAVSEVVELGPQDIEPPPAFGTPLRAEYLVGMGKLDRKLVLIVDLDRVIAANERELSAAVEAGPLEPAAPPETAPAPAQEPSQAQASS